MTTYSSLRQLTDVWFKDVELDALKMSIQGDSSDQQNDQYHIGKQSSEVHHLKWIKIGARKCIT